MQPPRAPLRPHVHEHHGDRRSDPYFWLKHREDPEVLRYLEVEQAYFEAMTEPLRPLQETIFQELLSHLNLTDQEVPVQNGPYFYYTKIEEGLQYRIFCRKRANSRSELAAAPEEVLLDLNTLAPEGFLSVSRIVPDPDHRRLAYLENRDGSDRYRLRILDLALDQLLEGPDNLHQASLEWGATGYFLFFLTLDETQRPYRLWRWDLKTAPTLLYEEEDSTFTLGLSRSRSGRFLLLVARSTLTDEVRFLERQHPLGELRLFAKRERGVKYFVEHLGDDWVFLTNREAPNFKLMAAPLGEPQRAHELLPYDPERYLQRIHPFGDGLVLEGRARGLSQLWLWRKGVLEEVRWSEPLYALRVKDNPDPASSELLFEYTSLLTPTTVYALHLDGSKEKLKEEDVPGYQASEYHQERLWAQAPDGVMIPLSIVYRKGALERGPAPLVLYGYGAYGFSIEPRFDPSRLPLLDRGIVYALAHVRGGGELGRSWYEAGKLLQKKNTFYDFIAAAEYLIERGYTQPDRLAAVGRSAGGLLIGAVLNLRPDLFRVAIAGVPFVDVMTTMEDPTIPLTTLEWDEWGNPEDPEAYAYMRSYSPYDNVEDRGAFPALWVETGLNDPRVGYWEPAKWVARLREIQRGPHPILFKIHFGAGHGGSSGRYDRLKETALEEAFLVYELLGPGLRV
jgi:oligopeptidase B